ncbi:MAG: SprT-like domain-containing protein [bacterium]
MTSSAVIDGLIRDWATTWGLSGLEGGISLSFSSRLRRSLGRCVPSQGRIVVSASLLSGPLGPLADVLCHETAHVAAFLLTGSVERPHGLVWRQLVLAAGFEPRVRHPAAGFRRSLTWRSGRLPYEHRCPVCQSVRFARRPVPRWRCAECTAAGLLGELVVSMRQKTGEVR